jgi:hypothetical protein
MAVAIYDPTGVKQVSHNQIAPRLTTLNGARLGILHNVKHNAKEMTVAVADLLAERYQLKEIVGPTLTAGAIGMLATPEQIKEFAKCDLVLTALGD